MNFDTTKTVKENNGRNRTEREERIFESKEEEPLDAEEK